MSKRLMRGLAGCVVVGLGVGAGAATMRWSSPQMLEVHHAPHRFARRSGDLSANICGVAFKHATLRYRLNGSDWSAIPQGEPRSPKPRWTLELLPEALRPGSNNLVIESSAKARTTQTETIAFEYDDSPVSLPLVVDWTGDLDVQDGRWEVIEDSDGRRVRPTPGTEFYDRMIMVTGAFAGGRRVETEAVFYSFAPHETFTGFGVLTMWGGHNDDPGHFPRRGWRYAIAWHMQPYGKWSEFSIRHGGAPRTDAFLGTTMAAPPPGSRCKIIAECQPRRSAAGKHLGYRQRMKLWPANEPEPDAWLQAVDDDRAPLPAREYAVALVAHECQVEFSAVHVLPLPPLVEPPVK